MARVLRDLLHLKADVIALQEAHFVCQADERVLMDDFVVYLAYGDRRSRGISLLVKRSLGATVDVVFAGVAGRLLVADVALNSRFWIVTVYAHITPGEKVSFFWELGPLLDPFGAVSFSWGLDCHSGPKDRQGWKGS